MLDVRRRESITLLGGAAVWPLAAMAQQKIYRLGALSPATAQLDSIRSIVLPELAKMFDPPSAPCSGAHAPFRSPVSHENVTA